MIQNLKFLEAIAREAGVFMRNTAAKSHTEKTNAKDFVTVADIKSQDIIRHELKNHYPDAVILSEEDPEEMRTQLFDKDFTGFVIDPIDGTYNFKRDMRESAISIGHITKGESDYGVIYDPYKDEVYAVAKGQGATRNGTPIHVNDQAGLAGSSIATSNSYDDAAMARNLRRHLAIFEQTGIMPWTSCPGSGVLIMAYVACGRIDVYHHNGLKPWDNAVGFLLVREAGGVVHDLQGGKHAPFTSPTVLMGGSHLVHVLEKLFAEAPTLVK
jgi:myo-inositol-1(or 4)-monophosphatase